MLLIATIRRDLTTLTRSAAELVNPLIFFLIVVSLFPLGISPSAEVLRSLAPGVIWIAALLAMMLSMDMLFRTDLEDGSLEQMVLTEEPVGMIVVGKIVAHWIVTGLPLAVISPVLALMLYLPPEGVTAVLVSLLLGTPTLSLLGAVGASLTVGLRRGGVLLAILILPLAVPVLILATAMIKAGALGQDTTGHMLWLGALLAVTMGITPLATAAGIRISVSQ